MFQPGAVAALAIDPFGQRIPIYGFGKRLSVARRNAGISVMAEHAVVADFAPEAIVIGPVVSGVHGPGAAFFGVPGERQFDEGVAGGAVEISARVIAGTHHVVDLLLHDVDLAAGGIELMAALIIFAIAAQHGEVAAGSVMVEGAFAGSFDRRTVQRASNARLPVSLPDIS